MMDEKSYFKVTPDLFDKIINHLKETDKHLDFDFNWVNSDTYLDQANKLIKELENCEWL